MDIIELRKILNQETGYAEPVTSDQMISDLGLDSLDTISFLFGIEQASGIKIPDEALSSGQIQTLGSSNSSIMRQKLRKLEYTSALRNSGAFIVKSMLEFISLAGCVSVIMRKLILEICKIICGHARESQIALIGVSLSRW